MSSWTSNPLLIVIIIIPIFLVVQWIFTNWRIKREYQVKFIEETYRPLYELTYSAYSLIDAQSNNTKLTEIPQSLRFTIFSDIRFALLEDNPDLEDALKEEIIKHYNR